MKGEIASVLVVAALVIGAGIGTFVIAGGSHTVTETPTSTIYQGQFCLVTTFRVFNTASIINSSVTSYGTSTQDSIAASFTTTGYPSSTTITPTATQTGSRAWNVTDCYLIP